MSHLGGIAWDRDRRCSWDPSSLPAAAARHARALMARWSGAGGPPPPPPLAGLSAALMRLLRPGGGDDDDGAREGARWQRFLSANTEGGGCPRAAGPSHDRTIPHAR
jgi:hypothetical protein